MSAKLPTPKNPAALLLLAGAALLLLTRKAPQVRQVVTPTAAGPLRYEVPTTVAERLARIVATATTPVAPEAPKTDLYGSAAADVIASWSRPTLSLMPLGGGLNAGMLDNIGAVDATLAVPVYDVSDFNVGSWFGAGLGG